MVFILTRIGDSSSSSCFFQFHPRHLHTQIRLSFNTPVRRPNDFQAFVFTADLQQIFTAPRMHVNAVAFFTLALTSATFVIAAPAESPTPTTKDPATPVINEEPSKQCSIIRPFGWIDTPCDWKTVGSSTAPS